MQRALALVANFFSPCTGGHRCSAGAGCVAGCSSTPRTVPSHARRPSARAVAYPPCASPLDCNLLPCRQELPGSGQYATRTR